ncbi:LysR family transcriptional regulator [Cognaticolwellia beringensis]|uniref:LysR family transcriptional regulator n=1 Tax=Cognaticolwellia beringensis TaxID=1967665 RepID=A0A222G9M7_9GAMM|nr:LysR family transcriptional regulator [Cognaticolwellia beringensis]ASP48589.1 LysR family transcriptional regulator [Cognaticolwellia beringensis]
MRLRHIEIFHAIYTTGSITKAAGMLHVSQPSVSKVLSHAEVQLGFRLFERVKGRLIPTSEAEMMFSEVDKIYHQLRTIKNTAKNIRNSEFGKISLGVTPALGLNIVPNAVAEFHKVHPEVNFDIATVHNESVMQSLLEHKCDLAILFCPKDRPNITNIELCQTELVVVYPKAKFPDCPKKLTLKELEKFEFIDINDSGPLGDLLWSRMMEENVFPKSSIKVQTYYIATKLVEQGAGLCVVDKHTAQSAMSDNISIASFDPPLNFTINALHLDNNGLSRVVDDFIPVLLNKF